MVAFAGLHVSAARTVPGDLYSGHLINEAGGDVGDLLGRCVPPEEGCKSGIGEHQVGLCAVIDKVVLGVVVLGPVVGLVGL